MLNLNIYELNTKHYENWLELYLQYANYYKVEIPSDKFELTWKWLNNKEHPLQGIIAEFNNKYVGFAVRPTSVFYECTNLSPHIFRIDSS